MVDITVYFFLGRCHGVYDPITLPPSYIHRFHITDVLQTFFTYGLLHTHVEQYCYCIDTNFVEPMYSIQSFEIVISNLQIFVVNIYYCVFFFEFTINKCILIKIILS